MAVLVTGGFGYIGSHIVYALGAQGEDAVIVDNMSTGLAHRNAGTPHLAVDIANDEHAVARLSGFMREHGVTAVIHMAAKKQVPESVARPAWYYHQNVGGLATVLMAMQEAEVSTIVYSSSAAVYGEATGTAISENSATHPVNPYGDSKLIGERMIEACAHSDGLRAASLRYFNVAGAGAPELGDVFALNLVPMVFERIDRGESPRVFGTDYPTPDGSCVRDFIHVTDLADAHIRVLHDLEGVASPRHSIYNVGTGNGYSVLEVIDSIGRATGQALAPVAEPRRSGDPASVVANPSALADATGWRAKYDLDDMTRSAWEAWRARTSVADLN